MSELMLIAPRRNFLIRALGFTAAGATLPVGIIALDDAKARIRHHQAELEKAWIDYYGPTAVQRVDGELHNPGDTYSSHGRRYPCLSTFMICASEDKKAEWAVESHRYHCGTV
ncbi:hypothetical protein [Bradyrhizobium erythrophlei]|uniref:Uncharacterized protein n=1 Tax=Bradyrhizobium erythrophlei TaxID=1437360 RepID=A0A1M7T788_9BRAD|nr:hypothetical protein [Bradyrhizobium erythrophlei]SHN66554.1 hypothetical protein SAMN05444170_0985 [Bradyrhizobium erythrophlei]